jgi:hypothetical protein
VEYETDPEQVLDLAQVLTIPDAASPITLSLRSATLSGSAPAKSPHSATVTKVLTKRK